MLLVLKRERDHHRRRIVVLPQDATRAEWMARVLDRIVALTSLLVLALLLLILPMLFHPTERAFIYTLHELVRSFLRVGSMVVMVMHLTAIMVNLVGGGEKQVFPSRALLDLARGEVKGVVLRLRVDRMAAMVH